MTKKPGSSEPTQNVLSAGSPNNDLGTHGGDAYFHARVAILGELPGEKLVELGEKDTVGYELHNRSQTQSKRASASKMSCKIVRK